MMHALPFVTSARCSSSPMALATWHPPCALRIPQVFWACKWSAPNFTSTNKVNSPTHIFIFHLCLDPLRSMFSALAKTLRRSPIGLQRRSFAKAVRPPERIREANESFKKGWLSDKSAYPIFAVMGIGGLVVLYEWYHAFDAPCVHILKGDRKSLDYVENDRSINKGWASHRKDTWVKWVLHPNRQTDKQAPKSITVLPHQVIFEETARNICLEGVHILLGPAGPTVSTVLPSGYRWKKCSHQSIWVIISVANNSGHV